jgi:UDP-hydrolysing UDP-N-acetyl-D-glucosamine 2-epimerase
VLVDRANYGRLKPVMQGLARRPEVELQVVAAGTMVLERFLRPVQIVERDGFKVNAEVYLELEGSTPATMAKSVGMGVVEFASQFQHLKPNLLVLIGDRYEALAAAVAAAYMNICIAHIQGGEVSGSIDESARHAISKFAQYHFPSTRRSADYLVRMGERPDTILAIGCPSSDIARQLDLTLEADVLNRSGGGSQIDVQKPFLLVVFHPTTTEYGSGKEQMEQLLGAIGELQMQTVLLWPNIDAGADHITKVVRLHRQKHPLLHTITNLPPEQYLKVLGNAACAIGNSSSFVRDAGYFGTPVVIVGNRQHGRETDTHVTQVAPRAKELGEAIRRQLAHGRYPASTLYGDGHAAQRIVEGLVGAEPYVQKRLAYIEEPEGAPHGRPRA